MDFRYVRIIVFTLLKSFNYPSEPLLSLITIVTFVYRSQKGASAFDFSSRGCEDGM